MSVIGKESHVKEGHGVICFMCGERRCVASISEQAVFSSVEPMSPRKSIFSIGVNETHTFLMDIADFVQQLFN